MLCLPPLTPILFLVCCFSCNLCPSLCFSCTRLELIDTRDRKFLQCQFWAFVVVLHRSLCGLAWSVVACRVSSAVRLTTVTNLCCGQVHSILQLAQFVCFILPHDSRVHTNLICGCSGSFIHLHQELFLAEMENSVFKSQASKKIGRQEGPRLLLISGRKQN